MKNTEKVSPKLREVEKEIDSYYKSNPLVKLPFATAAWSLLASGENWSRMQTLPDEGIQNHTIIVDDLINELKYSMYWLWKGCEPNGQVPFVYNGDNFNASMDLIRLAREYRWFVSVYTGATNGWIELDLQGSTIQPKEDFFTGIEYEAYNRLVKPYKSQEALSSVNFDNFPEETIERSLRVQGDRFRYKLNPRIVSDTRKVLKPLFDRLFLLPNTWQFSRYSLGDFREVFEAISTIACIRTIVQGRAAAKGCVDRGYADSIYVPTCNELLRRVVRYSSLSDEKVRSIFDDLSYGNRGVSYPDPALQPLIKLNSECYAIMPHLWLCCSPERNLTVLLNRLKSEKTIYAKLVDKKESLMNQRLNSGLSDKGFRLISGSIADLPDIDFAIISDSEKSCLLLELKWFIAPAEFREIVEKSKEIKKGINQSLKFKEAFRNNHEPLLKKLGIDASYRFETIVVSQNWIGNADVQSPEVPVIQVDHLIAKLKVTDNLRSTMEWLKDRKYLPKEGEHFKIHRFTPRIGKWSLKWYGIKPLIKDAFFPL